MSVEYKAIYGYGYHITDDMAANMDTDLYEEFVESDFTRVIDGWGGGNGYFFGITVTIANEGECNLIPIKEYEHDEFRKMLDEHHKFFPKIPAIPRHYLIHQVF